MHGSYPARVQNPIPSLKEVPPRPVATVGIRRRSEVTWLVATFVLLSALAFLYPANGDDWAWGSSIGIERLDSGFADYNGRNVANLVVLALTRMPFVAPFVVGATLTAIIFLIVDISRNRTLAGYAITTALLLAMPVTVFRETVSWMAGFTNYTLSTLLVLVYMRAVQRDWRRDGPPAHRIVRMIGIIVLAFLAAQFMENVTLFFVVASIAMLVAQLIRRRRASLDAWGWAIGFALGAAAMFSNGAYRRSLDVGATSGTVQPNYQQMTGIPGITAKLLDYISPFGVIDNLALNVVLAGAIILLAVVVGRRNGMRRAIAPLVLAALFLVAVVPIFEVETVMPIPEEWQIVVGLSALLLVAALVAIAFLMKNERRWLFAGCIATLLVLVAPLVLVSPLGPRLFLVTYCVMLIMVNLLIREAADELAPAAPAALGAVATAAAIGLLATYFVVYSTITIAETDRLHKIREAVAAGRSTVEVARLPFTDFVHHPDPTAGIWADRYKLYYDLPPGLTITLSK
jgi:hypothetical protein